MENRPAYVQLAEMSAPFWVAGRARLEGEHIVLAPDTEAFYVSQREAERGRSLVGELLALRDEHDLLGFGRTWGLLWHGPDADEYREPVASSYTVVSDLNLILQLAFALRTSIDSPKPQASDRLRDLLTRRTRVDPKRWPTDLADLDVERHAEAIILGLLNRGLNDAPWRHVGRADWLPDRGTGRTHRRGARTAGHFYSLTRYSDLVGYAYDGLRRYLLDRVELFECARASCLRIRPRQHGNQRYCSTRCESKAKEERRATRRKQKAA